MKRAPAKVKRTGQHQLSVTLQSADCQLLERFRRVYWLRSWGAAVRVLIRATSAFVDESGAGQPHTFTGPRIDATAGVGKVDRHLRSREQPLGKGQEAQEVTPLPVRQRIEEERDLKPGTLGVPLSLRREPTPKDFADPRFDVVWELIKRVDVDFRNGVFSGATGNDVCAVLDALDAASLSASPDAMKGKP